MILGYTVPDFPAARWVSPVLGTVMYFWGGRPFLTGAIPMVDAAGNFLYDVGMLETNRGCPYSCSFCYWGGATGQKVRSFSRNMNSWISA